MEIKLKDLEKVNGGMDKIRFLKCPNCGRDVSYTLKGFLEGETFICPNCRLNIILLKEEPKKFK